MRTPFITVQKKAELIVLHGLQREELFKFFDRLNRDVIEYIELFGQFGVELNVIWRLYEEWQEIQPQE